jgi:hypothetical protein
MRRIVADGGRADCTARESVWEKAPSQRALGISARGSDAARKRLKLPASIKASLRNQVGLFRFGIDVCDKAAATLILRTWTEVMELY